MRGCTDVCMSNGSMTDLVPVPPTSLSVPIKRPGREATCVCMWVGVRMCEASHGSGRKVMSFPIRT